MQNVKFGNAIRNDNWITDENVEDPVPLPNLPGYHVLVRPVSVRNETKGGLLLPDSTVDDVKYLTTVGRVLAVGDSAYIDNKKFPNGAWCQVGDYIAYGRHVGHKFVYKNIMLILIFDDQVIMKVEKPEYLDTMFNLSG